MTDLSILSFCLCHSALSLHLHLDNLAGKCSTSYNLGMIPRCDSLGSPSKPYALEHSQEIKVGWAELPLAGLYFSQPASGFYLYFLLDVGGKEGAGRKMTREDTTVLLPCWGVGLGGAELGGCSAISYCLCSHGLRNLKQSCFWLQMQMLHIICS